MKGPGAFGLTVTVLWGAFGFFFLSTWITNFRPHDSLSFGQAPIDVWGYFRLGSKCDMSLPSSDRGGIQGGSDDHSELATHRKQFCVYPRLADAETMRIQLGVAEHDNIGKPLKGKSIMIDREVSYTESTEIEFSNFTFPKRMREKIHPPFNEKVLNNLKLATKTSPEARLFLHFQMVVGGNVVNHKAIRMVQLCAAASRQTRNLMNMSKPVETTPSSDDQDHSDQNETSDNSTQAAEVSEKTPEEIAKEAKEKERVALEKEAAETEELTGRCWVTPIHFMVAQPTHGIDLTASNPFAEHAVRSDLQVHAATVNKAGHYLHNPLVSPDHRVVPSTWWKPLTNNKHRKTPTLEVVITPVTLGWYSMHKLYLTALDNYEAMNSGMEDMIIDTFSIKKIKARLVETALAYIHSLMAAFAFRNDVSFFNKKSIHSGVSRSAVAGFALQSLVSLLYLHDTPEINSFVLIMHGIETLIAFWKVFKVYTARRPAVEPEVVEEENENGDPKRKEKGGGEVAVKPKTASGYTDDEIAGFDIQAIKAVGSVSAVLFLGYLYYTLTNGAHRSWWSWFITSAAHASYAWGFVLMTPQLWVNYKLKSVAHLPWRAMVYKAFGTFADDVYAVMVPGVPLAYRLACLRDDVVFVLLLVQLWYYPTDKTRTNEYGHSFEKDGAEKDGTTEKVVAATENGKSLETKEEAENEKKGADNSDAELPSPKRDEGGETTKKKPVSKKRQASKKND